MIHRTVQFVAFSIVLTGGQIITRCYFGLEGLGTSGHFRIKHVFFALLTFTHIYIARSTEDRGYIVKTIHSQKIISLPATYADCLMVYLRVPFTEQAFKTESIRKLSNFNFQWTKTLYQNNLKHIAFFFTLFKSYRCNLLSVKTPKTISYGSPRK